MYFSRTIAIPSAVRRVLSNPVLNASAHVSLKKSHLCVPGLLLLALFVHPEVNQGQIRQSRLNCDVSTEFLIGTGIHDVTGPAVGLGMMGYANVFQVTAGIHFRLKSRAFIVASPCNGKRVVFVSADLLAIFQAVKHGVVQKLKENHYDNLYTDDNVLISATHDHAGPGGESHYWLYNLTIGGFEEENYEVIVDGIYDSIIQAHNDLAPGTISIAQGETQCAPPKPTCENMDKVISGNQSLKAYLLNHPEERAKYGCDVDTSMTLLKFVRSDAAHTEIGQLNWFAVHGTSMHNNNRLISGDNKGYASYLFERLKNKPGSAHLFVAAFAQSNEGDVTPNVGGRTNGCGRDDFESTMLSGQKQYAKATELFGSQSALLVGPVDSRHTYVKMDKIQVAALPPPNGDGFDHQTCTAAIGLSMLAGAEDGPGIGWQGLSCNSLPPPLSLICKLFTKNDHCQGAKPIAVTMGAKDPPWTPNILPIQLLKMGDLVIIGVPGEFTTMSGRRVRATVMNQLGPTGSKYAVIAGLSNAYSGYVTTRQEYEAQRYEGASTHFGPWTLAAYQQEFARIARNLADGTEVAPGPTPMDPADKKLKKKIINRSDGKPFWRHFGDVHHNANATYRRGETVVTSFWARYPSKELEVNGSFLQVEYEICADASSDRCWEVVAGDSDWETKFQWRRTPFGSVATVSWIIPIDMPVGNYRITLYRTPADSPGLSRIFQIN